MNAYVTAPNRRTAHVFLHIGLAIAIVASLVTAIVATARPTRADLGPSDFLKANGKFLRNNSGTGDIVTLRGTNLGGWLTYEDWMSPLGEFALDRTDWSATASVGSGAANALDGDATTRWTTGTGQSAGQYFQVDLGSPTLFNRVYLDAAGFSGTAPVGYQILVSSDGSTWKDVASGPGTGQLTAVPFSPQIARYVRVVQTGSSANPWSIAEFNLFSDPVLHNGAHSASASVTAAGSTPGYALDGDVNTRWTSGTPQAPGQTFTVDLGTTKPITKVLIDAGPTSTGDYPRGYEILTSNDGANWTKVASAYGSRRIIVAELFTTAWTRYIRFVQTGSAGNWWSIAEIAITGDSTSFDRTGWTITASSTEPGGSTANVKDGNPATRWSTGAPQTSGQWLQVDFGATVTFNQIVMDTAKNSGDENDYPRGYTVQVSMDGSTWTQVASGVGGVKATPINFPAVRARYFRITQTGSSGNWWSVGELTAALNNDDYSMNLAYQKRFGPTVTETIINHHQQTWIQESDLDNLQAMGMNLIRLPIGWTELLNLDGTWKADPWTMIDWLVAEAGERNMYVLLDLHTVPGGGCPWGSCGRIGPNPNGFWTSATYQDWVVDIWEAIADRYKGNPTIAGYDLINEPLIDYAEDSADVAQKSAYYDRLYDAVRAIDPDHLIVIAAFFGWNAIAPPSTYGWTNVMYELHPYDFPGGLNHAAQDTLVQNQLNEVGAKLNDPAWNVPVLYGEYSLYHYDDVWAKFMGGLNALHVSWTNWNYKVRGDHYNGAGGYWGFYNSNPNPVPIINSDTPATIMAKTSLFATSYFQPNTSFINVVSRFTGGQPWLATVPLDQTGWTATASSTEAGGSPANALDWNPATRWSTGVPQSNGQWFQVNMGTKRVIDQISFETRSDQPWDFPRGYTIQVSADGTNWTTVRTGQGWGWKQVIPFAPQYAQYVRVTQTGSGPDWWSIAEFHIFGEFPLSRTGWSASASVTEPGSSPANAIDASLATRWSTGTGQASGQWFQLDLGQSQTFNRLLLDAATSTGDSPAGYQVQVSPNGSTWTTVHTGTSSGQAVLAEFPVQYTRYVRIVQTGTSGNWWSIHDLQLYGEVERSRTGWSATASSTEGGGSPTNAFDGNPATRWSTGADQAPGQWYRLDLGSSQWFNHIIIDAGSSTGDYPREYIVETSNNATNWTTMANGRGTGQLTTVNFPITQARYIRITMTASSGNWWSIAELRVFE